MACAVIFGANGQDGYYLGELLRDKGIEVIAVSRSAGDVLCDVADFSSVEQLIKSKKPEYIFHLAASSTTRHDTWLAQHTTIAGGAWNILESAKRHSPGSRIFVTGSGLQFKNLGEPISEFCEFEAGSPYSVARISSAYTAKYYRTLGLTVFVGYLFHHESPRRSEQHVSKRLALAVSQVCSGSAKEITVGSLDVIKEWAFAGDIVKGIWTLVNQDEISEAVIGSGVGYSIGDWVDACFAFSGFDSQGFVVEESGFVPEYKKLVSDPSSINRLGWSVETDFKSLVNMFMTEVSKNRRD